MQSNITYCFDTVEVNVTTSDGGMSVSHVLLPTLSDTGVSIIESVDSICRDGTDTPISLNK